ncbi:MAG: hypothetical protein EOP88_09485 [Verrucomicrobiaceae bacterium]|nr:MAG: hypothetical protein EOP88_09485 [Verrucomicrobiaceae bacterium]
MKASVILTVFVLAIAGWFGWRGHVRVDAARQEQEVLEKQAAAIGLSAGDSSAPPSPRKVREPEVEPKALFAWMANHDGAPDMKKLGHDLSRLDEKGMEIFVREILASEKLKDGDRGKFVMFLMDTPLSESPGTVFLLFEKFTEAGGKLDHRSVCEFIPPALARWASRDPHKALDWVKSRVGKYPDYVTSAAKCGMLTSVAGSDPAWAFREIGALGIGEPLDAMRAIMRAGDTREQRLSVLAALRAHVATLPDERVKNESWRAAIGSLAASTVSGGEASARQWIASAGFSPMEADAFAAGIAKSTLRSPDETGRWIAFLADAGGETFPTQPVREMMENWTKDDYRAAGQWLTTAKDDRAKETAVRAYAETVAKYDPATAEQWALTLPAGEARTATFSRIHSDWPENDAAGKAGFAERHGFR